MQTIYCTNISTNTLMMMMMLMIDSNVINLPNTDAIRIRITKNTTSDMLGKSFCFLRIFVAINSYMLNIECD